ncbi:MAG: carboxyltransferase domain-containing protein [Saprospiraceae bacterium]
MNITNYNNDFLIIKSDNQLQQIGKAIFEQKFNFVTEVIVTEKEICVKLNRHFESSKIDVFHNLSLTQKSVSKTYELPVYFTNHEDWKRVEVVTGFSKNAVIEKLISMEFSIAMFGFLPGFLYLDGLDESLHIPRKAVPSKYVEANSIAIGGKYLGLYSVESPGGWNVIGKIDTSILDLETIPPVKMNLGDKIRLKEIKKSAKNLR